MAQEKKLYTFNDMQRQCFFAQMKKMFLMHSAKLVFGKKLSVFNIISTNLLMDS
jgi:hypothetical protein